MKSRTCLSPGSSFVLRMTNTWKSSQFSSTPAKADHAGPSGTLLRDFIRLFPFVASPEVFQLAGRGAELLLGSARKELLATYRASWQRQIAHAHQRNDGRYACQAPHPPCRRECGPGRG